MELRIRKFLTINNAAIAFLTFLFFILFQPVILKFIETWDVDPNYSHGFFIPFISLYFVYTKWELIKKSTISPSNKGLLIVLCGLILFILGWISSLDFVQGISMLIVLWGSIIYLYGKEIGKLITFPICYLVFMIPLPAIVWNRLSVPLSLIASSISTRLMELLGMVVYREGNVITLPNITLQVVEACSGLRSLVTLLALSAALGNMSNLSVFKKIILFLCAIPIAIVGNVIRLTATGILAENFGAQMAQGFIHEFSGWVVFIVGFFFLFLIQRLLEGR